MTIEDKADMMAQRAEARAEERARKAAEAAAAAHANAGNNEPMRDVVMTAAYHWDPRGDDPEASTDDVYRPEEAAIRDHDADYHEKASAWRERAVRMLNEGRLAKSDIATRHADYHDNATNDTAAERRERKAAEARGEEP